MKQANNLKLQGTVTVLLPEQLTSAVKHGWHMLERDLQKVLKANVVIVTQKHEAQIVIRWAEPDDACPDWPESYVVEINNSSNIAQAQLHIVANDPLGLIYGMLYVSRQFLGVEPFWFWGDVAPKQLNEVELATARVVSEQPKVKYRGWFVNDEVCLIGWTEQYPPPQEVWLPVFEALLRYGGNMVIPGTDLPKEGIHVKLAQEMGLWVTHHHAEPLGAEMFLRAFPGRQASYKEHPELFEQLWQEAIDKQCKEQIVWVLSFRGQGDKPFWENDPEFDTPSKRGAMISKVIARQYEMIGAKVEQPVCSVALYGEIAELYKGGHVVLPEQVIKIWADNGYGKMVSRRHGNINLRVPALPAAGDDGPNGIYYHVTFHDLQASNHLTMMPVHPSIIQAELEAIAKADATEYLLVNSGNIRQHLFLLDLLSQFWMTGQTDYRTVLQQNVITMYGEAHASRIVELYEQYWSNTIRYGKHEDDRAGDEYYHHPARKIAGHWLQGKGEQSCPGLHFATGEVAFAEQVRIFRDQCAAVIPSWQRWQADVLDLVNELPAEAATRLQDHLLYHGRLHLSGSQGLYLLCESYLLYLSGEYAQSFVRASQSMKRYMDGVHTLRQAEHNHWQSFYKADWLTNIQLTVENMDTVRRFVRMHGDNPDFFLWYKAYLMPEEEKHIYLENTHRNPLSDNELALKLAHYFGLEE